MYIYVYIYIYMYMYIYNIYTLLINKQIITNRWMKEWGIQIASEQSMRQRVNDMRGE